MNTFAKNAFVYNFCKGPVYILNKSKNLRVNIFHSGVVRRMSGLKAFSLRISNHFLIPQMQKIQDSVDRIKFSASEVLENDYLFVMKMLLDYI